MCFKIWIICVLQTQMCFFQKTHYKLCFATQNTHFKFHSKDTFQPTQKTHFKKTHFKKTHFKTHISWDQLLLEKYKSWNVSFDIIIWFFKIQMCFSTKYIFVFQKTHLYFEFPSGIPDRDDEICILSKILCVLKRHICFSPKDIFAFQKSYLFFEF